MFGPRVPRLGEPLAAKGPGEGCELCSVVRGPKCPRAFQRGGPEAAGCTRFTFPRFTGETTEPQEGYETRLRSQ